MTQCRACRYQAIGQNDLASHIESKHGFAWPDAWAEAGRVMGTPDLRQERIDILASMVQDLRARLSAAEGENVRLRAALEDQIELWKMAKDTMNIADARMGRVKFMEYHDPIKAIRAALGEDIPS